MTEAQPQSSRKWKESRRQALLDAAKSLLWERGFEAMSPRAVQEASQTGQGSFYHHFSGKQALAAAAIEEIRDELVGDFDAAFRLDQPPLERIEEYLGRLRDGLKGCRIGRLTAERSIAEETIRAPVAAFFEHVAEALADSLAEAQSLGHLPRHLNPGQTATMLVAVIQGGYALSRAHRDAGAINAAAAGAIQLLKQVGKQPA